MMVIKVIEVFKVVVIVMVIIIVTFIVAVTLLVVDPIVIGIDDFFQRVTKMADQANM